MSTVTISDGTFSRTVDTSKPKTTPKRRRKSQRYWQRSAPARRAEADRKKHGKHTATISDETRQRLHAEALAHPLFEGESPEFVHEYIEQRIATFLSRQPFWFGQVNGADARHRANQRQYHMKQTDQQPITDEGAL
jgi:hypothetical protein